MHPAEPNKISFTTKKGEKYSGVTISNIRDNSISIVHNSGAATISFDDLPDGLVGFPEQSKLQITSAIQKRETKAAAEKIAAAKVAQSAPLDANGSDGSNTSNATASLVSDNHAGFTKISTLGSSIIVRPSTDSRLNDKLPAAAKEALDFLNSQLSAGGRVIIDLEAKTMTSVDSETSGGLIHVARIEDINAENILFSQNLGSFLESKWHTIIPTYQGEKLTPYNYYVMCFNFRDRERGSKALFSLLSEIGATAEPSVDSTDDPAAVLQIILSKLNKSRFGDSQLESFFDAKDGKVILRSIGTSEKGFRNWQCEIVLSLMDPQGFRYSKSQYEESTMELAATSDKAFTITTYAGEKVQMNPIELTAATEFDSEEILKGFHKLAKAYGWRPSKF